MKRFYKDCSHTVEEEQEVPEELINMTKGEVEQYYSNWRVSEFSEDYILIYKEEVGICPEHYVVKELDGKIVIFNVDKDGKEHFFMSTEIFTKYLSEEDKSRLKLGVKIVGNKDLNLFLEDYDL